MKKFSISLLVLAGSMVSGCSLFSSPDTKTLPAPLAAISGAPAEAKVLWTAAVGSSEGAILAPAIDGTSIYAASADGAVVRIDAGRQAWRIATGKSLTGGVGSDGKVVVVGTAKGQVLAYGAADGHALWSAQVDAEVLATPLVVEGLVVVRAGDARVYAFDANSGERRWVYQRSTPALSVRSASGLSYVSGAVLAGFSGGKVVSIALSNGNASWEASVSTPKGSTELERLVDVTSSPAVLGREFCAAAYRGKVACFDLSSNVSKWTRDASSLSGVDVDGANVYVSEARGAMSAFDRKTGNPKWVQNDLGNRSLSRPLVVDKLVVVGDVQGYVHLLRTEDGSFAGRIATDGSPILTQPRRFGDAVLVQTRNGNIYAVAIR